MNNDLACRGPDYLPLYAAMDKLLHIKRAPVIGIDGNAGGGKTTLASALAAIYACNTVHADSFFLPMEKRTAQRLCEIGGNIDYERMQSEIFDKLPTQSPISYNIFDCSVMAINKSSVIQPSIPIIIEGSYSLHPYFKDIYDMRIFVQIDSELQKERILARNDSCMLERFISMWIPMENTYFSAYDIKNSCDIVIANG